MNMGFYLSHLQFAVVLFSESLRIAVRTNVGIVSDDARFYVIPFSAVSYVVLRAIKMSVMKQKSINFFIV